MTGDKKDNSALPDWAAELTERNEDADNNRRGRRVAGLFLVAALLLAAWFGLAAAQRGRVTVAWQGEPSCTGTDVVRGRIQDQPVRAMRLVPGMSCQVSVRVVNEGWMPVRVEQVRLPFMGPGGGAAVRVRRLDGERPDRSVDRIDATFPREVGLRPTETDDLVLRFTFRPRGCTAQGLFSVNDFPTVTVSALGLSGERTAEDRAVFRGTRWSVCDD